MSGRQVAANNVDADAAPLLAAPSSGATPPWQIALAVVLPVLAITLLAWQVCPWAGRQGLARGGSSTWLACLGVACAPHTSAPLLTPPASPTLLLPRAPQLGSVYSKKMARLPELIRQQRKRALGQPRTGRMSLVITDIQGFSHLMQRVPDEMTAALLQHNAVIRRACYDNIGFVVEQEGDSYSVVFYDPEDAVAFALQVRLLGGAGWL
jgi:hypothetical protein